MALILSFSRAINILIRRQMDEIWESRANLPATEIADQTLGIIGLGGIGLEVAKRADAFGMRILAVDPVQTQKPDYIEHLWRMDKFHDMLKESDFVAICCPLTPKTKHMVGEEEFMCMKPTAYLINIARGGIVDQEALIKALTAKEIAGAGIDVTEPEPLPKGNPLWQMENVIITPHIAGQSPYSGRRLMKLLCENLRRFTAGEPLLNTVDKKLGY
jgi:phosphoglycerate dehydrogenase-like enzyme